MLNTTDKIIKHKTGLLNLAEELGNVSKACQVMGYSRDRFYRYKSAVDEGGVAAFFERTRRTPIWPIAWTRHRSKRSSNPPPIFQHMAKRAHHMNFVNLVFLFLRLGCDQSGFVMIWPICKSRLKALEAKIAEEGGILTEAQVQALEKKKHDDEACG